MRTNRKRLDTIAGNINRIFPTLAVYVKKENERYRLMSRRERDCCEILSPCLSAGQLADWMWAFIRGAETVIVAHQRGYEVTP